MRSSEACLGSTCELCDFLYYNCLFESKVPADLKQAEPKSEPSGAPVARAESVDTSPVGPRSFIGVLPTLSIAPDAARSIRVATRACVA